MKNITTAFLLGSCIFGSLALTAAVPVLAQRAGTKATCEAHHGRGWSPAEGVAKFQVSGGVAQITRFQPFVLAGGC